MKGREGGRESSVEHTVAIAALSVALYDTLADAERWDSLPVVDVALVLDNVSVSVVAHESTTAGLQRPVHGLSYCQGSVDWWLLKKVPTKFLHCRCCHGTCRC